MSLIHAIGTALPAYAYRQDHLSQVYANGVGEERVKRKIKQLSRKSGIEFRHSVIPGLGTEEAVEAGFHPSDALSTKMKIFENEALKLSLSAIGDIPDFEQIKSKITHLIAVSCTGLSAPGLDIEICRHLNLPPQVKRAGLYFLGCNAAILALRQAHVYCEVDANALVLIVCTELCTLHFQENYADDYLISNTLFADGSAAMLIGRRSPYRQSGFHWKIESFHSHLLHQGRQEMAWRIGDKAFLINLTGYVSDLISGNMEVMMEGIGLNAVDFAHWAIHPGGIKILDGFAKALKLEKSALDASYQVLRKFGNMSSVTIFFVLKALWETRASFSEGEKTFAAAFGPGLSIESMVLQNVFIPE